MVGIAYDRKFSRRIALGVGATSATRYRSLEDRGGGGGGSSA